MKVDIVRRWGSCSSLELPKDLHYHVEDELDSGAAFAESSIRQAVSLSELEKLKSDVNVGLVLPQLLRSFLSLHLFLKRHQSSWIAAFPPCGPEANELAFRDRLKSQHVALERVEIRNRRRLLRGYVKVRNLALEKTVLLRWTANNWRSFTDASAHYVPRLGHRSPTWYDAAFDTFEFDAELPQDRYDVATIEFCIGFHCKGGWYWDNNGGRNYRLLSERYKTTNGFSPISTPNVPPLSPHAPHPDDAYHLSCDTWSEFASWLYLSTERPYW